MKISPGGVIRDMGSTVNTKTGGWRSERPVIDNDKCIECGSCWIFCPDSSIIVTTSGNRRTYSVNLDFCKGCGICANECPSAAIKMILEEK
ncbi:MAG TPA: 4Fe-4S dicluster domain-containing protein [Euryarchaeota archaeon]|nr:pyruvate synthase subunit PorD [archaeon BMS3Abin16]GBE57046.1 pyruvate synthase subunit PorD [archaeon BMS3Bbin16]HDH28871.1 4Fe-4S dicluster domain-containing protein [Euryarchaeota archaeon]HDY73960.1 4Fe-4S dicluster domain-containing protein [Euryarchaeota archaeon]